MRSDVIFYPGQTLKLRSFEKLAGTFVQCYATVYVIMYGYLFWHGYASTIEKLKRKRKTL